VNEIWEALRAPFPPHVISWRVGATNGDKSGNKPPTKGIALAYIDARDVMDRLDEVVGPENWECRYPHAGQKTVCEIGIRCDGNWVYKADGAGDTDTEAEKGALSDAFKRAAVRFGIGRYLYSIDSPWVELEARGRSYVIKQSELPRLRSLLPSDNAPANKSLPPIHGVTKTDSRALKDELCKEIDNIQSMAVLLAWKQNPENISRQEQLNDDLFQVVKDSFQNKRKELLEKAAA
jgi:hypothetical protein